MIEAEIKAPVPPAGSAIPQRAADLRVGGYSALRRNTVSDVRNLL